MKKIAVFFGGRSGEHQVSLVSASSVIKALDKTKYEVVEVGITEGGEFLMGEGCMQKFKDGNYEGLEKVVLDFSGKGNLEMDIAYPVLHGPFGEDGTIQGLFEMLNVPYVGCGVLASSVGMDKVRSKILWKEAGIDVVPWIDFKRWQWEKNAEAIISDTMNEIGFPCFVKPVNMGSSVGVSKAKDEGELRKAIELAMRFDSTVMVEKGLNVREIECAVLGNNELVVSEPGEVLVGGEFYDFHDKYVNGVSSTEIPAKITEEQKVKIREIAEKAFRAIDGSGLSRVDSFIDQDSGDIFINEINTSPGFTSISMYPKMIEHMGISYGDLVDKLIDLAVERFEEKSKNMVHFDSGSDWFKE